MARERSNTQLSSLLGASSAGPLEAPCGVSRADCVKLGPHGAPTAANRPPNLKSTPSHQAFSSFPAAYRMLTERPLGERGAMGVRSEHLREGTGWKNASA